jgi:hypothetical protein
MTRATDRRALAAELANEVSGQPVIPADPPTFRRRNYAAMGATKLTKVIRELEAGPGNDAYDRCKTSGSGDPAGDLRVARAVAARKAG